MKTEITIEGKNLNDIFRLPYVTGIVKLTNGDLSLPPISIHCIGVAG